MKWIIAPIALMLSACSSHPSSISKSESERVIPCSQALSEYVEIYEKQENSFIGDVILVSLIGLPLMTDHEEELAEVLATMENCEVGK